MNPIAAPKAAAIKVRRVRVYTRLSHALRKRLTEYCAAAGRSERAVIEEAVSQYLAGSRNASSAPAPIDRLVQAIDNDQRKRDLQHRDLELLSEAFGRFLQLWMTQHASTFDNPGTPAAKDAARKRKSSGESLYRQFAVATAEQFTKGHRFVHDLPNVEDTPRNGARTSGGSD
jgi:hypothetical protein